MTLVHHECIARNRFRVDFVRIEEVNKLGFRDRSLPRGYETDIICGRPRCDLYNIYVYITLTKRSRPMYPNGTYPVKDRETVPFGGDQSALVLLDELGKRIVRSNAIRVF